MSKRTGSIFVAILVLFLSIPIMAQSTLDLEVSAPQFIYDVNSRFNSRVPYSGVNPIPATTITNSPVQQVSALFRNTGSKIIKAVSWEFVVFRDAQETKVLRVLSVHSNRIILPSESVRLTRNGYQLPDSPYRKVHVTRIEYADGTTWTCTKTKR